MRRLRATVLLALLSMTAAPQAIAQSAGNPAELVNQLSQLRSEVQELRGQIEELQQQLEQARQAQRGQYLDLDSRLGRLEGGKPAVASTPAPAAVVAPAAMPASIPVPAASNPMSGMSEGDAYRHAFDALRGGDYAESARRFADFVDAFPSGQYAPNALYWLGESYYVTQNYELAGEQFQSVLDRYPTHDKAAGALLKLGLAKYGLRDYRAAEAALLEVIQRYPGSDLARTADDRLRALDIVRSR